MTATWTTPKTWATAEALIASDLNTHLRDNLDALKSPPTDHYELNEASDYTTTSTTFVDVDGTNLSLTITPTSDTVMIGFNGAIANNTATGVVYLDVDINGSRFAGDDGILAITSTGAGQVLNGSFVVIATGLTPDTAYTFKLQWKQSGGTGKMWAGAGSAGADLHPQFWVREVS